MFLFFFYAIGFWRIRVFHSVQRWKRQRFIKHWPVWHIWRSTIYANWRNVSGRYRALLYRDNWIWLVLVRWLVHLYLVQHVRGKIMTNRSFRNKFMQFFFRLFLALDVNRDGHIDFKELCCGISAACRGPTAERLKCKLLLSVKVLKSWFKVVWRSYT